MPKASPRRATALPMRPRPAMPRVRPRSGRVAPRGQPPALTPRCCGTRSAAEAEQQGEGVFGDGVLVGARRDGDGDAVRGGGRHIHSVIADADAGDDAQLGMGVEDAASVRL